MVRRATRRLLHGAALTAATVLLCAAWAAPSAAAGPTAISVTGPTAISIAGPGVTEELTVPAKERPEQFAALLAEVNWLAKRPGQIREPEAGKLGPKYVLTVYAGEQATHRYELYPMAVGGPRAYRPASQPDKHRTTAGWFYGRLSMPDTLRLVGVPLAGPVSSLTTGGIGGGGVAEEPFDPNADISTLLAEWRRFLLLNGAVVVVIAAGLAGISLFVRRRTDRLYHRSR